MYNEKLKDRIFINNPGGLLSSFPKEQFGKVSWPRNKLIADLLSRTIFMEKVGTGIKRKVGIAEKNIEINISKLKQRRLLRRIGPAKGGHRVVERR